LLQKERLGAEWEKGSSGWGGPSFIGILRVAQDDSRDRQCTGKTDNGNGKGEEDSGASFYFPPIAVRLRWMGHPRF
jgi:hypothetical protein